MIYTRSSIRAYIVQCFENHSLYLENITLVAQLSMQIATGGFGQMSGKLFRVHETSVVKVLWWIDSCLQTVNVADSA